MPKSRKRKPKFRTRVEEALRYDRVAKNREAVMDIYNRALPKWQEYPPLVSTEKPLKRAA